MKKTPLASLIMAALASGPLLAAVQVPPSLPFNTQAPTNDLQGTLAAQVQFAQSQILPAHVAEGDSQPSPSTSWPGVNPWSSTARATQ